MVDSSRKSRRDVMGSHNRCWIWGRNAVLETLKAGRWPIHELVLSEGLDAGPYDLTVRLAEQRRVSVSVASESELTRLCRTGEHQGMAARMPPFPWLSVDGLLSALPKSPCLVILDRLQDPFNLGAIIRSASALGVDGVIAGTREQADISSQVVRSSAGAVNHIPLGRTDNLVTLLDRLREESFQICGASERATTPLFDARLRGPTALIIGNEGQGIQRELLNRCQTLLQIPMTGSVGSLNAAVAASILFYEVRRQRMVSAGSD